MRKVHKSLLMMASLGTLLLGAVESASAGWFSFGSRGGSHGSSGSSWGSSGGSHGSSGGSWGSSGGSHGSSGGSWGSSGGSHGSSGGSWGSSGGYYAAGYAAAAPAATVAQTAYLDVHVPTDAIVYLQNQRMTMTGGRRRFVTPAITSGRAYTYTVKVEAQRDGQLISKTTSVTVRAGQEARVVVNLDAKSPIGRMASMTPPTGP